MSFCVRGCRFRRSCFLTNPDLLFALASKRAHCYVEPIFYNLSSSMLAVLCEIFVNTKRIIRYFVAVLNWVIYLHFFNVFYHGILMLCLFLPIPFIDNVCLSNNVYMYLIFQISVSLLRLSQRTRLSKISKISLVKS